MPVSAPQQPSFRDQLATIDKKGRRVWVYPLRPKGAYYSARTWVSFLLLAFLFAAPFIKIGGHPLLQFDIINRHFFIFGLVFWPQDLHLFVLTLITFVIFVILFTAVYGRLFCGWACPQTIFMEMVFRKIEYAIDGNAPRQRELAKAPWTAGKIFRRASKLAIFYAIAFLVGNTFLAYIIGVEALWKIVTEPVSEHLTGFFFMVLFSLVFFWVFSWFREQACTIVCPYGRLQSVLLDNNSLVVHYDFKRGEPRTPFRRGQERSGGDCIECDACVNVCPTGIDIRNGTQLECVNCTACMDACDRTMRRVEKPTGLIRYATYNEIAQNKKQTLTPRIALYLAVFGLLLVTTTVLLATRTPVEAAVLRATGSLFEELSDGSIRNLYTFRATNKTARQLPLTLRLGGNRNGLLTIHGPELILPAEGQDETVFSIQLPKSTLLIASTPITIEILSGEELLETVHTTFVGPQP